MSSVATEKTQTTSSNSWRCASVVGFVVIVAVTLLFSAISPSARQGTTQQLHTRHGQTLMGAPRTNAAVRISSNRPGRSPAQLKRATRPAAAARAPRVQSASPAADQTKPLSCGDKKPVARGISIVSIGAMYDGPDFTYSFYIPITCRIWSNLGVHPSVTLTGDGWDSEAGRLMVEQLRAINGTTIHFMNTNTRTGNIALSQVARSFAVFQDGVPCDAYVFTSDADLFPLDLAPFIPLPNRAGIGNYMNVYNGDCCWIYTSGRYRGESCGQVPMASVGADAWLWRKLMIKELRLANVDISTPSNDGNLAQRILQVLRSGFNFVGNNMTKRVNNFWSMDQIMLGCVAKHFNDTTAETENGLDLRVLRKATREQERLGTKRHFRIDRGRPWPWRWDRSVLEGRTDAHIIRPGFGSNWDRIQPLISLLVTPAQMKSIEEYQGNFTKFAKKEKAKARRQLSHHERMKLAYGVEKECIRDGPVIL